jgi:uncharacterized protein VirK/YbjX
MRPRDFLVELFRHLCLSIGVEEIKCIANSSCCAAQREGDDDKFKLNYADIWRERGGVYCDDGFFRLSPGMVKRHAEGIPAKKRSVYRQRYELLDSIAEGVSLFVKRAPALSEAPRHIRLDWVKEKMFSSASQIKS